MAIKGKKKSKGTTARRPAAAPRPQIPVARTRRPFYKTRDGMFIIGIFVLVAIGIVIWLVGSARDKAREKEQQQQIVETYTDQVQPALVDAGSVISTMNGLTTLPEKGEGLTADAEDWSAQLQEVQISFTQIFPTPEVQPFHELFNEVLQLYVSAARTFGQIEDVSDADLQAQLFTAAQTQRDLASAMFQSVISSFDTYREALDMGASGLTAPATGMPADQQTPEPETETITTEPSPEG